MLHTHDQGAYMVPKWSPTLQAPTYIDNYCNGKILCLWLNFFLKKWGIYLTTIPWYLIANLQVACLKHLCLQSGAYDKTFNYTTPSNTLDPCTTRGGYLGLVYNTQDGYKSLSLKTGKIINPHLNELPLKKKLFSTWRCLYWTRDNPPI